MSKEYNEYLRQHRENVAKGFKWIKHYLPELIIEMPNVDYEHQICYAHDQSKNEEDEYNAYDDYFYGMNVSYEVKEKFYYAWLKHIHKNPHHWQHWILINDEPEEGEIIMDMPYNYILEMVCDWWAFSWNSGELGEMFGWYMKHKFNMKLSDRTRKYVEYILMKIELKLKELKIENE